MLKEALRQSMKHRLSSMRINNVALYTQSASLIVRHCITQPVYQNTAVLLVFIPMKSEVNTIPLIRHALQTGKIVFVPLPDVYPMRLRRLYTIHDILPYVSRCGLTTNIPVPVSKKPSDRRADISISQFQHTYRRGVICVPGLAFTQHGDRMGRGGGFYDRLLSVLRAPYFYSIGICFECQIVDSSKMILEIHDKTMDYIIHEQGCIKSRG